MRGDVHAVPGRRGARGHEQRGARYGVILQSDDLMLSTVLVAPTSRSAPPRPFRPAIELAGAQTTVLLEQTRAIDIDHLGEWVGRLTRAELDRIEQALALVLALD